MPVSKDLLNHYEGYYSGAEGEWRRLGAIDKANNILRAWKIASKADKPRVVELGCGDGAIANRLAELGFCSSYRGFDISESGIEKARQRALAGFSFAISSVPIPIEDNAADVVIMSHVVEHLEHPRELIAEARRIAPILIVEVPLELNGGLPDDYDWDPVGHINKYERRTIRQLIQTCQFDIVGQFTTNPSIETFRYLSPGVKGSLKWAVKQAALKIAPQLSRSRFTYHETVVASRSDAVHPHA